MNIQTSLAFEEEAARIAAGIPREVYDALPGTPEWLTDEHLTSKCHVLAHYRLSNLMQAIMQEAVSKRKR